MADCRAMSDLIDNEGFRTNVGIVLMRANGEVFLGRRTGGRGWQFPQGGVRQGEPVEQALYRELQEEIGLTREHVRLAASDRKSTRLNSSHLGISYAVFCLKKKKQTLSTES